MLQPRHLKQLKKLRHDDYQVCWICPLDIERTAAEAMLDEVHDTLPNHPNDTNIYTLGTIGQHNVAIAGLPTGNSVSTANAAQHMKYAFKNMRVVLLVGIGNGVPSKSRDIRLGDIVVSYPDGIYGGVIQVDSGKTVPKSVQEDGFIFKGALNQPPDQLLNVVKAIQAKHKGLSRDETPMFVRFLADAIEERPRLNATHPGADKDYLFEPTYDHSIGQETCENCDAERRLHLKPRHNTEPRIHLGLIASANNVREDGYTRERLRKSLNVLCFETEAAGAMNNFPCLVVRGISDYADTHKNDAWQPYAALAAASYAKEWLLTFPEVDLSYLKPVTPLENHQVKHIIPFSLKGVPNVSTFVAREVEVQKIEEYLLPKPNDSTSQRVHVLHGMGGIGKTQLAIEYARKSRHIYSAVLWLDGSSQNRLEQSFQEAASRIPKAELSAEVIECFRLPILDADIVVKSVLEWLSLSSNIHWLMIIDNVDRDITNKGNDPEAYDVKEYLPEAYHGSIIITSRLAGLARNFGGRMKVGTVNDNQARAILESNAGRTVKDAEKILGRLCGLPLALTQAGAFIGCTGMSGTSYVEHYDKTIQSWGKLLRKQQDRYPLQEYAERSILTTWTISYQQIVRQNPAAGGLMRLWGFLNADGLWYELVRSISQSELNKEVPQWLLGLTEDELEFSNALGLITQYSLAETREATTSYSMHSVLHRWCSYLSADKERSELFELAANGVADMIPSGSEPECWKLQQLLLPHGLRLYEEMLPQSIKDTAKHTSPAIPGWTYDRLGSLFSDQNKLTEAEEMYQRALQGKEKAFGLEHISTLNTVHNLGLLYSNQSRLVEAEEIYHRALRGYEKILGPKHTSTIGTVNSLGSLFLTQGKLIEAENMYQRALQGHEEALGLEHISTLRTANNLGLLYSHQGKFIEAEDMYQRALKVYEKVVGLDHTSTLRTVSNLGLLYSIQGKLVEAEDMLQQALRGMEKALGPEHTSTLRTVHILGRLYFKQGKLVEAEEMYHRALQGSEETFGPEHKSTLDIIFTLGNFYYEQEKLMEAEEMCQRALQGYEKTLGPRHTSTLNATTQLNHIYVTRCFSHIFSRNLIGANAWRCSSDQSGLHASIVSALHLCRKWARVQVSLFGQLGRMVLWVGESENAIVAFEQQIVKRNGKLVHGSVVCDGCDTKIPLPCIRYVCRSCKDLDLCPSCYQAYQLKGFLEGEQTAGCQNHDFVEVPRDGWVCPPPGLISVGGPTVEDWLDSLLESFTGINADGHKVD